MVRTTSITVAKLGLRTSPAGEEKFEFEVFSLISGDTISRSGWKLALKCTSWGQFNAATLAMSCDGVGTGAPKVQNLIKFVIVRAAGATAYANKTEVRHTCR